MKLMNKRKSYFLNLNAAWLLTPLLITLVPSESSLITFAMFGLSLIVIPYLIMNIILWRKLNEHMEETVCTSEIKFFNAIRKAKSLGLQKDYCNKVSFWLMISKIGVVSGSIITKYNITRWS